MTLNIVVILYNKSIQEIKSLNVFIHFMSFHKNVKLYIFDNSENEYKHLNKKYHRGLQPNNHIYYFLNGGNIGLSKAYNRALHMISNLDDWIMWSDDDTLFSLDYLEHVYEAIKSDNSNIISGIIRMREGKLFSPLKRNRIFHRTKDFITETGIYNNIYCVNTGLVVNRRIYELCGLYDECLFLDMIDFWFMEELEKRRINRIELVEGEIIQDFSGDGFKDYASEKKRDKIYRKDFSVYCKLENKTVIYKYVSSIKRYLKLLLSGLIRCKGK